LTKRKTKQEIIHQTLLVSCRAICIFCKNEIPYNEEKEQHENHYHCKAKPIRALFSEDWSLENEWKK
jgi:hypothetical protein